MDLSLKLDSPNTFSPTPSDWFAPLQRQGLDQQKPLKTDQETLTSAE